MKGWQRPSSARNLPRFRKSFSSRFATTLGFLFLMFFQAPAMAQSMSGSATPTTFMNAGDIITFHWVIEPGAYTITSVDTPITTSNKNASVTCGVIPPGGTTSAIPCISTYTVTASDALSGQFADFVTITGSRVGGTFDFTSNTVFVQAAGGGPVIVSVDSSPNPSQPGESVNVTANVSSMGCNAGLAPPGTVTISIGANSQTLALTAPNPTSPSSTATMSISSLTAGSYPVSATYSGGSNCSTGSNTGPTHHVDTPPSVTINQAAGQSDPTSSGTILFDVVFDKPVTGFTGGDVQLSGTAGATTANVSGSGSNYTVSVSGMSQSGTVSASIPAGGATSAAGFQNSASTSTDNLVNYVALDISPASLPNPVYGQPYGSSLSPIGGSAPHTFSLVSGSLPTGLTLANSGDFSGTVSGTGSFNFTVQLEDQIGNTVTRAYSVTIAAPVIAISPATLSQPVYNTAYSETLNASGGVGSYIFSVTSGALPSGLILSSGGDLSGTPTVAGNFDFTVTAEDGNGQTGTQIYSVSIAAPTLGIAPISLPAPVYESSYSEQLSASGGAEPYSFSLDTGVLPNGLSIASDGTISGTPIAAGPFNFSIRVTDANGFSATQAFNVLVAAPAITVSPASLSPVVVSQPMSQQFTASGGAGAYSFSIVSGALPASATFASNGLLSGVPTSAGTYNFRVRATDQNGYFGETNYTLEVSRATTTTELASSLTPSTFGAAVTFTATVTSASGGVAPTGSVEFFSGGNNIGTVPLSGSTAALAVSNLPVGTNVITAAYSGDLNNGESTSAQLLQVVQALGTVVIRQVTTRGDGAFAFTSPEPELNFTLNTVGGEATSSSFSLSAKTYTVTAAGNEADGFALTSISCNDGDSSGDVSSRTANINLAQNETVICTFSSANSRDVTSDLIADFLETRANMILENQPDLQRRVDRLNGHAGSSSGISSLLSYLPQIAETGALKVSTSLNAVRRMTGDKSDGRFDLWFEGSYNRFEVNENKGDFSLATVGADYVINRNLLVGAFVQIDNTNGYVSAAGGTAEGTGWLAGPYVTARLSENIFLDLLAGAGTARNEFSPFDTYTDTVDSNRWLVSAALQGNWQHDAWTFTPHARLSYFEERTKAYTDSLGVAIPDITSGLGQVAFGPGISYRHVTQGDVTLDFSMKLDGVINVRNTEGRHGFDNFHGRVELGMDASLPSGGQLGISTTYSGIGSSDVRTLGGRVRFMVPLN